MMRSRVLDFEAKAKTNLEAAGAVFKPLPPDEMAKWRQAAPDLLKAWQDDVAAKGKGEMAATVAARWRQLVAQ